MSLDQNPKDLVLRNPSRAALEKFDLMKGLGEGAFGKVYLSKHREAGSLWAIKQLKKYEIIKGHQVDHLKNECYILFSVEHPFIVRMNGLCQDQRFLYIIMEYVAGGELFKYLRRVGKFNKF